jgi:catechol 2,3-dioxygenase-like lactoylglutathione lyase family enzyme
MGELTMASISNSSGNPNILAVHSVHEFVFCVPDLVEAEHFYSSFGLNVRIENGGRAIYTEGGNHRWATILQGPIKRLLWVTFGIYPDDRRSFEEHLNALSIKRIDAPPGAPTSGIWLAGPDGLPLQLIEAEKCSPSKPAPREFTPECANSGRAPSRQAVKKIHPLYLSHILMFTADTLGATAFYEQVLGLKLSDRSQHVIAFLHTPHGSDHHLIALALSDGPGLHHSSWCVPSIDAVALGTAQMARSGYPRGWGIGRHVLGSNYFQYVRDPWNSYAEYSYDIDFVAPGKQWPSRDHPVEDSIFVWGPDMPDDFVKNFEI